ncbi:MAG: hypothetical protein J0H23_13705 [Micrococcales bacterium]|nr:hypothetical protein [Micrococcales bacterium]
MSAPATTRPVVPWEDDPAPDARKLQVGATVYRVPSIAAVRLRGDLGFIYVGGVVRVLTERGELALTADEELELRLSWPNV